MPQGSTLKRKERKARIEEILGIVLGFVLIGIGVWGLAVVRPEAYAWWPALLVMLGQILVFMSFLGFATYLEKVDEERYFPDPFRTEDTRGAWQS